jgi:MFS transporter, DHA2 family, multidrug resistance protein
LAARYGAIPGSLQTGHAAATKRLWQLAYREASTLAYADAFLVIMIVLVIATLLVPFLRNVAPTGTASSQAH